MNDLIHRVVQRNDGRRCLVTYDRRWFQTSDDDSPRWLMSDCRETIHEDQWSKENATCLLCLARR